MTVIPLVIGCELSECVSGVESMFASAQRPRRAAEMLLQQSHGFGGIAAQRSVRKGAVLAPNITMIVVTDGRDHRRYSSAASRNDSAIMRSR